MDGRRYAENGPRVLDGVTFTAPAGRTTAVRGGNGIVFARGGSQSMLNRFVCVGRGHQRMREIHDHSLTVREAVTLTLAIDASTTTIITTIVSCRFYDPDDGTVRVNGVDTRDIEATDIHTRTSSYTPHTDSHTRIHYLVVLMSSSLHCGRRWELCHRYLGWQRVRV